MPTKLELRIVHVSGQDESYKGSELNRHSPLTKGWQAGRYCLYPQDLVFQMPQRSRLKKIQILSHQYLIATKIEFFIGDVPEDMAPVAENAKYQRLGYVSLSDNEKTGYKARELKSVHVDAIGIFLKLLIHKNHINKYNTYNQVGIIAVNAIGDPVLRPTDYSDLDDNRLTAQNSGIADPFNKPDYISPLDDLAFDMYQDPEIAGIIRKLEKKKQEAVLQERFDYAKRLKQAVTDLQKVGEKLGKLDVEKRQSIENEDYDKAKLKKIQMDEYRLQVYKELNLNDLLELSRPSHYQHIDLEPLRQPTPPRLTEIKTPPGTPPKTPYDERPIPALRNKDPAKLDSPRTVRTPYDERPLPVNRPSAVPEEDENQPLPADQTGGITEGPEPMTEKDLREASSAIDVFGEPLVSKAYSKTWSYREDALLAVYKEMQDLQPATKDEAKTMLRAAVFLIKKAIDDKVYAVFKAGLHLLKMALTEYIPKHKIPRGDTSYAVERTLVNLLHKTGDTAARNRDDAKKYIVEEAQFPEVKPTNIVPHECVKPLKQNLAPRLAQSRAELVEMLYKELGINNNSGLTTDNMMVFCVSALGHNASEVRNISERIIKSLYKEVGSQVKDYLPPDDDKTRKITLYRQLFEFFDKVDGKPSKSDIKRQKNEQEAKKQAEIDALQKQLQTLKDITGGAGGAGKADEPKKKETQKKHDLKKPKTKPTKADEGDDASMYNMDNICIFCGERNESFTEEGLDLHYWKNCPMLKRCTNCKQVVEIASYTDHLLSECEAKANYAKCPRCSEAIHKSEYDQHVAEKTCNPSKAGTNHCPLCHQNIDSGEEGWKKHLMGKDGCKQNPRRLLALNKPAGSKGVKGTTGAKKK
ncbi:hypothetical protein KUTeg_002404 [Tegillarca granosa]|uniref:TOG domain-containing protein n=1 Tax=Tegillarca granosa TaxID=220873 RepID=A0ABQ9FXT7_TEGGR|nr:hypothetical protein KUTeg_002404 [Tegillarca granosa]